MMAVSGTLAARIVWHSILWQKKYAIRFELNSNIFCNDLNKGFDIKQEVSEFFDLGQQKGLFARTIDKKVLPVQKVAVTLQRQKEQKPGDKDNKTLLLR